MREKEEALALLDTLLRTAPVGFAFVNTELRFVRINDCLAAINGRPAADHIGRTVEEVVPALWPFVGRFHRSVLETGRPVLNVEVAGETAAAPGRRRHWLTNYYPVHAPDGRLLGIGVVVVEVTERKEAEEEIRRLYEALGRRVEERTREVHSGEQRFRHLLDSCGEGIYGVDAKGVCTFINRTAARMLGAPPGAFEGRVIHDLIHHSRPDGAPHPVENCQVFHAFRAALPCRVSDEVYWRADGTAFPVEYTAYPLLDGEEVRGAVVTFYDITARKKAEEELRQAKEAAEAASRAKGEFLANVSHEIRTPMNGVIGMTELVLDTDLTAEQREHLETVKSSADALLRVINDLLDFSKIEAGRLDLDPAPFRLRDALKDILRPLTVQASGNGLVLSCRVAPNVPDGLVGDFGRLRQIVANLVGNAVKFTEDGEVIVHVSTMDGGPRTVQERSSSAVLQFEVCDTGIGIPAERLTAIFEPFVQADGSVTRRFGGTGLGLTISARLVRLMGGDIDVTSEVGRGTTVRFTAPFGLQTPAPEAAHPDRLSSAVSGRAPLRVLLAEDNAVNRRMTVLMLEKEGLHVETAGDGREAVAAWERDEFDLVLMDVQMPEMDGLAAAARIRLREQAAGRRRTPIVALTAHAMKGDRERCLKAGMDGYLTKPIRIADLARVVGGHVPTHGAAHARADAADVFDRAALLDRLGGQFALVAQIAAMFRSDGVRVLGELRAAAGRGDAEGAHRAAHTLTGMLANLGAARASTAARRVEGLARGGDLTGAAAACGELEHETVRLRAALDDFSAGPVYV